LKLQQKNQSWKHIKKLAKKYHPDLMAGKSIKEKEKSGEKCF
jgi:curved DNA-binding protein CbpA